MGGLETGEGGYAKGARWMDAAFPSLFYFMVTLKGGELGSAAGVPTMIPCCLAGDPEATG